MMTSKLPLVFVVAAVVLLAATGNLFSASPIVIVVQAAAVALNVWARASFASGAFRVSAAPAGAALMRHGPYRIIRHPMYAAALLFIWAGVLADASVLGLAIAAAATALAVARVIAEERLLRARYPDYGAYARTTNALVPYVF